MNFSRRHLLASLGLVVPTMAVMATEANATTTPKKHRPVKHHVTAHAVHRPTKHHVTAQASHKPHKPSRPSSQG